jgi:hypothetical protein
MITRFAEWQGREPESVAADTTYGNREFLQWLAERNTIVAATCETAPWLTSGLGNVAGLARSKRSAPVEPFVFLPSHMDEPARQRARKLSHTPEFAILAFTRNDLRFNALPRFLTATECFQKHPPLSNPVTVARNQPAMS